MPSSHPLPPSCHWFSRVASALDPRSAPRLAWLLVGVVLARGRRTVTSWIRTNVRAFHLCLSTCSRTAAWAWNRDEGGLVGHRSASP